MSEEKKKNYLEEAVTRIYDSLRTYGVVCDSDPTDFLEDVRKELVQSFKNGIEVGKKRASKQKGNGEPASTQRRQGA